MSAEGFLDRVERLYTETAKAAGVERAIVRCRKCGRVETVNGIEALRRGWPLCHGETMELAGRVKRKETK